MDNFTSRQEQKDELGFYTRQSDGTSGMSASALADFCGVRKAAITKMLDRIRDFDPLTKDEEKTLKCNPDKDFDPLTKDEEKTLKCNFDKDSEPLLKGLPESLELYTGQDWRLAVGDSQNSVFIIDEVCHAILEYYAIDARKYKGKQVAVKNYRMVSRAGLRVFIWSQTGYSPQSLSPEQITLLQAVPEMQKVIASLISANAILQEQVAELQVQFKNPGQYIPPGWDKETWEQLPSQDKSHFRFLHRRRGFKPTPSSEQPLLLSESLKQQQIEEMQKLVGKVSEEEKQKLENDKKAIIEQFWDESF